MEEGEDIAYTAAISTAIEHYDLTIGKTNYYFI